MRKYISIDIPVVFLSALDEVKNKTKGFDISGVDNITKPFQAFFYFF
jgi:DNA-binding response OmpR family regulator